MFYFLYPLADVFSPLNLFRYLTFRSIAAFLTALVLSFLIGGGLIRWLRSKQAQGQPIRDDGPDGLAIGPVIMASAVFGLIAYVVGNTILTNYLYLHHVPRSGELAVLLAPMIGAGLGFLWFNAPPAMVFMGDTGSLAIGGALGAVAVVTKHEIVLAIVGGLFVLETVSVIVQVLSFKWTGRRVFRMAPLHHHFEKKGWAEPTIVIRFWIIASILALAGLATLKLR